MPRSARHKAPELRDDALPLRRQQANQLEVLRGVTPRRRVYSERRAGQTFTVSFSVLPSHDQIIDHWAAAWNVSRAEVVRKMIDRAHADWLQEGR